MKHAIIMTGQLRTWKYLQPMINRLRETNDIDFFLSIDMCNKIQNEYKNSTDVTTLDEVNESIEFFKPIAYYYNSEYSDDEFLNYFDNIKAESYNYDIGEVDRDKLLETSFVNSDTLKIKSLYSKCDESQQKSREFEIHSQKKNSQQYLYVYKGYELLENHIRNHNIKYKSIIRLRFDQMIWNDKERYFNQSLRTVTEENKEEMKTRLQKILFHFDTPKSNEIFVYGGGTTGNYVYVNDQFWCHHMDQVNIMKNFYLEYPNIIKSTLEENYWPSQGGVIEHFFAKYLYNNNLCIKKSKVRGIFIREYVEKTKPTIK